MSPLSGMTGFGRADGAGEGWTWSVEARSVNGRNLEVRFRGPNGFDGLERAAKAAGQARFARGQVTIGVQAKRAEAGEAAVTINAAVLARYLTLANELAEDGATPPSADGLLALRGVIEAALPRFEACYRPAFAYAPGLWGRLGVRFHITERGKVDEAFEFETHFPDERVALCALRAARELSFPKPTGGDMRFVVFLRMHTDRSDIASDITGEQAAERSDVAAPAP